MMGRRRAPEPPSHPGEQNDPEHFHDRADESAEAKARWFQTLTMQERMELFCAFTDMVLENNPRIADLKDAEQTSEHIRILTRPRG